MGKKQRDSRYELLRIIAMLAITLNHTPISEDAITANIYIHNLFFLGGQFGVNLFVIIGAWFLCEKDFTSKGIIRIIEQMIYYSILLDIVCAVLGFSFSLGSFARSFSYWFPFGYVFMLVATPVINRLPYKTKRLIAILGFGIASLVTCLGIVSNNCIIVKLFLKGVFIGPVWFCFILVVVAVLKPRLNVQYGNNGAFLFGFFITYVAMYVILIYTDNSSIREVHSPLCFMSALFMFEFIRRTKINHNHRINKLAHCAFGAYLFQSHQIFKTYLWEGLFQFSHVSEVSTLYIVEPILIIVMIVFCTFCIDNLQLFIKKRLRINSFESVISNKIDSFVHSLCINSKKHL